MIQRDYYWDTLKFVLIFLVVYGHTISDSASAGSFNKAIYNFIFIFHMPLFVFISGRFSHMKEKNKYKKGIICIFETYIIFQLIRLFLEVLLGETISLSMILSPRYTLWYLLCLVYWRLLVLFISPETLKKPFLVLSICFIVAIFGGFVPIKILSIQRAMTFLPFFFLGYYSTQIDLRSLLSKIHIGLPIIALFSLFIFIFLFVNKDISIVILGRSSYWSHNSFSPFVLCLARCIWILTAICLSFFVMRLVRVNSYMAKFGGATLVIYIYHSFITQGLRVFIKNGYLPEDEILLIFYAFVITIGLAYLSQFKIFKILLNPITYFRK